MQYVVSGVGCVLVLCIDSLSDPGESLKSLCFKRFFPHTFLLLSQDTRLFRSSEGNDSDNDCNTEDARGSTGGANSSRYSNANRGEIRHPCWDGPRAVLTKGSYCPGRP